MSLLEGEWELFSGTWPVSGSMRSGECFQRAQLARSISESGFSSWDTPQAHDGHRPGSDAASTQGSNLKRQAEEWPTPASSWFDRGQTDSETWKKRQAERKAKGLAQFADPLHVTAKIWPTPTARDYRAPNLKTYEERDGASKGEQLPNFVEHNFPLFLQDPAGGELAIPAQSPLTPTPEPGSTSCESGLISRPQSKRRLNPRFVEWLMGWPPGWTDFPPVGMESFRLWLDMHSARLRDLLGCAKWKIPSP
jgi:DNA (cytosine-5)-methyltransferase 1